MTHTADYNPTDDSRYWMWPHTFHISDRALKGVKTHSLIRMVANQEAYTRACLKHRHELTRVYYVVGDPTPRRWDMDRERRAVQILRRLRAELKRRQETPPVPKHNHGKGTMCPLLRPPRDRGDERLSA